MGPIRGKQALETEDPFCLWMWITEQGLNRGTGKGGTQKHTALKAHTAVVGRG